MTFNSVQFLLCWKTWLPLRETKEMSFKANSKSFVAAGSVFQSVKILVTDVLFCFFFFFCFFSSWCNGAFFSSGCPFLSNNWGFIRDFSIKSNLLLANRWARSGRGATVCHIMNCVNDTICWSPAFKSITSLSNCTTKAQRSLQKTSLLLVIHADHCSLEASEVVLHVKYLHPLPGWLTQVSFVFQTTQRPYWRSEVVSGDGSSLCIACPCWSWTAEVHPSAAPTRSRYGCVTATRMAWPCLAAPWPTQRPASAPARSSLF